MSILLADKFHTPFETIPFNLIKNDMYLPAIKEAILNAKKNIEKIKSNLDRPTFKNTFEALDECSSQIDLISGLFFNLHNAESSPELQNIAKDFSPLLTEFSNDVTLDALLFQKIKTAFDQGVAHLGSEEKMLAETKYKGFIRNGALLNDTDKNKLREIDNKLSKLVLEFGDHVLEETNEYVMWIEKKEDLEGLPASVIEAASTTAKEKNRPGAYAFTLQHPSYLPFMTYSKVRELREQLFIANATRACKGDKNDNKNIIKEIVFLRNARANLLGHKNHAQFVLEERMASSPEKVDSFLKEIFNYAYSVALKQFDEMKAYAKKIDGITNFKRSDTAYYSEMLKKELYNIDNEILRPYFKLEKVISGVFLVAKKLYNLDFKENKSISVYHSDVKAYTVEREGKHVAIFYADFFPREGKRAGAWMTSFRGQKNINGKEFRPHISIVCNFTKPTKELPSLLTLEEVLTLFHEFGHALHGILANTKYESLSGTNVYWDFVELPSQILENWVYEKECLDLFAEHYQTKEKISQDLIEKIRNSSNFQEGIATIRQITLATLDMAWHTGPHDDARVEDFEDSVIKNFQFLPLIPGTNISCSFSHIFNGGYSAGYYSYKWAEVLDADAFEYFKEKGVFNKEVAKSFQDHILSKGGSEHPMDLYRRFRGKDPSPSALLKRAGLL